MSGRRSKNDATAICEAVQSPHMCLVPIKTLDQQSHLMVYRARQGFVEQHTATLNRIRGLLAEFGIVLLLKAATVRRRAGECLKELPGWTNMVIGDLLCEVGRLGERIAQYDRHIRQIVQQDARAQRLNGSTAQRLNGVSRTPIIPSDGKRIFPTHL